MDPRLHVVVPRRNATRNVSSEFVLQELLVHNIYSQCSDAFEELGNKRYRFADHEFEQHKVLLAAAVSL